MACAALCSGSLAASRAHQRVAASAASRQRCLGLPAAAKRRACRRVAAARRQRQLTTCAAGSDDADALSSRDDAERLNRLLAPTKPMTGEELRQLVLDKWGVSYDVRLQKRGRRMYLHVMWKFLEQKSFPLSEEEYTAQLQAVAEYLNLWEVQERVRDGIRSASRGPGYTGGGGARAISIPLDVDVAGGGRADEWNSF